MTTLAIAYTPVARRAFVAVSCIMRTHAGHEVGASFLIREDGVSPPDGFTARELNAFGVTPKVAVAVLSNLLPLASRIAVHDAPRLTEILARYYAHMGSEPRFPPAAKLVVDTAEIATAFCRLPGAGCDDYRAPTLAEATRIILGQQDTTARGVLALADHLTKTGAMEAA